MVQLVTAKPAVAGVLVLFVWMCGCGGVAPGLRNPSSLTERPDLGADKTACQNNPSFFEGAFDRRLSNVSLEREFCGRRNVIIVEDLTSNGDIFCLSRPVVGDATMLLVLLQGLGSRVAKYTFMTILYQSDGGRNSLTLYVGKGGLLWENRSRVAEIIRGPARGERVVLYEALRSLPISRVEYVTLRALPKSGSIRQAQVYYAYDAKARLFGIYPASKGKELLALLEETAQVTRHEQSTAAKVVALEVDKSRRCTYRLRLLQNETGLARIPPYSLLVIGDGNDSWPGVLLAGEVVPAGWYDFSATAQVPFPMVPRVLETASVTAIAVDIEHWCANEGSYAPLPVSALVISYFSDERFLPNQFVPPKCGDDFVPQIVFFPPRTKECAAWSVVVEDQSAGAKTANQPRMRDLRQQTGMAAR